VVCMYKYGLNLLSKSININRFNNSATTLITYHNNAKRIVYG
jgi:hypothetical protein